MNYLISLDWFQYCCRNVYGKKIEVGDRLISDQHDMNGERIVYDVVNPKEYHSIYKESYTIQYKRQDMVHVHYSPASGNIPQDYVAVKVANRMLYTCRWGFFLHDIINILKLHINNITRVDICCDFQRFANDITPHEFITNYVADYSEDQTTYIRKHSNRFTPFASKVIKTNRQITTNVEPLKTIKTKGKEVQVGIAEDEEFIDCKTHWQTIRWGSRNSAVMVEIYNKTKELNDKHHKPYIFNLWQEIGLIEDGLDVYRIEFSISSKGLNYSRYNPLKGTIDKSTFETLKYDDFSTEQKVEALFWSYANEYFHFREFGGQKYFKDMPVVQLFPQECLAQTWLKPRTINTSHDTGRSERLAASTFEKLSRELLDIQDIDRKALNRVAEALARIGALKNARTIRKSHEEHEKAITEALDAFDAMLAHYVGEMYDAEDHDVMSRTYTNGTYTHLVDDCLFENQQVTRGGGITDSNSDFYDRPFSEEDFPPPPLLSCDSAKTPLAEQGQVIESKKHTTT